MNQTECHRSLDSPKWSRLLSVFWTDQRGPVALRLDQETQCEIKTRWWLKTKKKRQNTSSWIGGAPAAWPRGKLSLFGFRFLHLSVPIIRTRSNCLVMNASLLCFTGSRVRDRPQRHCSCSSSWQWPHGYSAIRTRTSREKQIWFWFYCPGLSLTTTSLNITFHFLTSLWPTLENCSQVGPNGKWRFSITRGRQR